MVNLILLVLDADTPLAHRRVLRVQIDGCHSDFVVARSPGDLAAIRAEPRAAAGNLQVDDLISARRDEHHSVADPMPACTVATTHLPFGAKQGL